MVFTLGKSGYSFSAKGKTGWRQNDRFFEATIRYYGRIIGGGQNIDLSAFGGAPRGQLLEESCIRYCVGNLRQIPANDC